MFYLLVTVNAAIAGGGFDFQNLELGQNLKLLQKQYNLAALMAYLAKMSILQPKGWGCPQSDASDL